MVSRRLRFALWWRSAGMGVRVSLFLASAALLGALVYLQRPDEDSAEFGRNILVFLLINLNIAILFILGFLVGRNVVRLVFDRRRRILGSKLRLRLVSAFVGLILIPTTILFFLASGLLTRAMQGWFGEQVEESLSGAVQVAKEHYRWLKADTERDAVWIQKSLAQEQWGEWSPELLRNFLEERRTEADLFSVQLFDQEGVPLIAVSNAAAAIESFQEPPPNSDAARRASRGRSVVLYEESGASRFVRAYLPLAEDSGTITLLVSRRIDPALAEALAQVNDSFISYEQLKLFRHELKTVYLLTLAIISALILFAATWIGFYIARQITGPIQRLAEGTKAVARGNYDYRIRRSGDDEIGLLVDSFNRMTADIKQSREEGEKRRLYIEAVVSNLAVGVIGLTTERRITSINLAAAHLFGIETPDRLVGLGLRDVLTQEYLAAVESLLDEVERVSDGTSDEVIERLLGITSGGQELRVVCTAGRMIDSDGQWLGTVLLFDDITELVRAQHMAAWREVARRIAHEIKNPLTPIQLSAQRLARLLSESEVAPQVSDCSEVIVKHVESIKRLANEFSNFARLPQAEFEEADLNKTIANTIAPYAEEHSDIIFQFIADSKLPMVVADQEQLQRVLVNLIENAVSVLKEGPANETHRIVIRTRYERRRKDVVIEVADNGPGIQDIDKVRVFEPYFTTKSGGTGLGLAIVNTIVSDHQGTIRVYDNQPHGAKFIVNLPIVPKTVTQRRFEGSALNA